MGTLDYGRDQTDVIVREFGNDWWEATRKETGILLPSVVKDVAAANDVDPDYLMWVLMGHRRSWTNIPGSGMLDAAKRLYLESVNRDRTRITPMIPDSMEGEQRVNKALRDLVKWAQNTYADKMAASMITLLKPAGERVRAAMWEEYQDRYTTSQARKMVLHDMPLRVKDHPHWFRDPRSLHLLLEGVLG